MREINRGLHNFCGLPLVVDYTLNLLKTTGLFAEKKKTNKNKQDQKKWYTASGMKFKICYTLCTAGKHLSVSGIAVCYAAILKLESLPDLIAAEN